MYDVNINYNTAFSDFMDFFIKKHLTYLTEDEIETLKLLTSKKLSYIDYIKQQSPETYVLATKEFSKLQSMENLALDFHTEWLPAMLNFLCKRLSLIRCLECYDALINMLKTIYKKEQSKIDCIAFIKALLNDNKYTWFIAYDAEQFRLFRNKIAKPSIEEIKVEAKTSIINKTPILVNRTTIYKL